MWYALAESSLTLLSLIGPPKEVMPLSRFLMIHGCSTTEMAREGMGSHLACCLSVQAAAGSGWLFIIAEEMGMGQVGVGEGCVRYLVPRGETRCFTVCTSVLLPFLYLTMYLHTWLRP